MSVEPRKQNYQETAPPSRPFSPPKTALSLLLSPTLQRPPKGGPRLWGCLPKPEGDPGVWEASLGHGCAGCVGVVCVPGPLGRDRASHGERGTVTPPQGWGLNLSVSTLPRRKRILDSSLAFQVITEAYL